MQRGETPGSPRFKPASRFDSLYWESWWLETENSATTAYLMGIGEIKSNYHRPMKGEPKSIIVSAKESNGVMRAM